MRYALTIVAVLFASAAWAQKPAAGDDVDALVKQFKKDWKKAERDEEKRSGLLVTLQGCLDERVVPVLIESYDDLRTASRLRATIAGAFGNYPKSADAAAKLASIIKENAKPDEAHKEVLTRAFVGMSKLGVGVSRKKETVDLVASYLSNKDNLVATGAARCLGAMRAGDAIDELLKEMLKNQNALKSLFKELPDNCDGG